MIRALLQKNNFKKQISFVFAIITFVLLAPHFAFAAINKQINYQGKLTTPSNVSVVDGAYNVRFKLYTTASGGSPIWTEAQCYSADAGVTCNGTGSDKRVSVANGLFSTMLGSVTSLVGIDFNQTLYLSVEIGGSSASSTWDGEMSPRKIIGSVPSAFVADTLQGLTPASFFRTDTTNSTSSASTFLSVTQTGTGAIANFFGTSSLSVLSVQSNGNVGIGTSTPTANLALVGNMFQTPTAPTLVGSSTGGLPAGPNGIFTVGNYAYVAGFSTFSIFDISNPTSPTLVGSSTSGLSSARAVYVAGKYAYIGDHTNGLIIFDISNKSNPVKVGSLAIGAAHGIFVSGHYAYLPSLGQSAVRIVDVANPAAPVTVGSATSGLNGPAGVYVSGRYLYVADNNSGLVAFDISNPVTPAYLSAITTGLTSANAVYVSGRYAYVGDNANGVVIYDISNPASPVKVGATSAIVDAWGLNVSGRYLYVMGYGGSFTTFDVSNPASPVQLSQVTTGLTNPNSVAISGRYAFVADYTNGVVAYDLNGSNISSAIVNSLGAGNLQVINDITAGGNLLVNTSLSVGLGGIFSAGALSVGVSSTTQTNAISAYFQGLVGIGTTSPAALLGVNGSGYFAGNLTATGTLTVTGTATSTFGGPISSVSGNLVINSFGTTNNLLLNPYGGNVGIGTTTPLATLAIQGNGVNNPFLISSSTGTAMLSVLANGNVGVGTSTPGSLLTVAGLANFAYLTTSSTTATSTFAGPLTALNFTGSSSGINTGDLTLSVASSTGLSLLGQVLSITGNYGIPLTASSTNWNNFYNASSTYLTYTGATGAVNLNNRSLVNLSTLTVGSATAPTGGVAWFNGNVGIGNSSPLFALDVTGAGHFTSFVDASYFVATSTTATTTIAGGLNVANGALVYDQNSGVTSINSASLGATSFAADSGIVNWIDMQVTNASATSTIESYSANLNGNPMLTVYGLADGNGGMTNLGVGIGTTTPTALLALMGNASAPTAQLFDIASSTGASLFHVMSNGNVGIGTSSLTSLLTVAGNVTATAFYGDGSHLTGIASSQWTTISGGINYSGGLVGIGSSTPIATLSVQGTSTAPTTNLFAVASSTGNPLFTILASGFVGIGSASPQRALDVLDAANPQLRLSQTNSSVYTDFQVAPSTGDLTVSVNPNGTAKNVTFNQPGGTTGANLWVCQGDACPAITLTNGGNIVSENSYYFGNGMRITSVDASTTAVYDTTNTIIMQFDEGTSTQ